MKGTCERGRVGERRRGENPANKDRQRNRVGAAAHLDKKNKRLEEKKEKEWKMR